MCKALLYYLAQAWTADRYGHAQRDEPARAAGRAPQIARRGLAAKGGPANRRFTHENAH